MTAVQLVKRTEYSALWTGLCGVSDCERTFDVRSEQWHSKIEVLTLLSRHSHRSKGHLHGDHRVTGYFERGGE